ncbi:superoxide dismutase [Ni] [Agaribacter marinus]
MKQLVQAQFEQFSGAHDLVHTIMLTSSACKQHSDREKALSLFL